MSISAHYVTQSSIYDCPKLGLLTDRRIEQYRKRGFYSTGFIEERREKQQQQQHKGKSARKLAQSALSKLLYEFV